MLPDQLQLEARAKEVFLAVAGLPEEHRRNKAHALAGTHAQLTARIDELLLADRSRSAIPDLGLRMETDGLLAPDDFDPLAMAGAPLPTIPGFTLLRPIGAGAFGLVYLAEQDSPKRPVAIKVLRPGPATAGVIRRFRREAELLARLRHPAIARVYGAGSIAPPDGRPYIILEYVGGRSITSRLADLSTDTRGRLRLLAELADAVHHAHTQGVLHRDLKPSNVFLDEHGAVRVLDFGVARLLDAGSGTESIDSDSRLFGSVAAMSPEALGLLDHTVDTRSDIYSLGAIAHEVLGGRPPFGTASPSAPSPPAPLGELLDRIRTGRPAPLPASVPRDAAAVVRKAIAVRPDDRYQSAAELAEDLRLASAGLTVRARSPTAAESAARLVRQHPRSATGVCTAVLAAALGVAAIVVARERAAENAELAIATADIVLHEALDHLGPLSGTIAEREAIVVQLEQSLPQLSASRPDDPRLSVANARLLSARAGIEYERLHYDHSLSLRRDALTQLDHAIALPTYTPRSDDLRLRSLLLVHIGDAERMLGNTSAALDYYEHALAADDARVRAAPDDSAALIDRLWSHQRLAKALLDSDRPRSLAQFQAQDRDALTLLGLSPTHPATLHAALQTLDDAGVYPVESAIARTLGPDAGMTLARRLLAESPANRGHRQLAAGALLAIALARSESGDHTLALTLWNESAAQQRTLELLEPNEATVLRGAAHIAGIGAQLAERRGDPATAATRRREAVQAWHRVLAASPDSSEPSMACATATAWLAAALHRIGASDEARSAVERAIDLASGTLTRDPDTPEHLPNLLHALLCAHGLDPASRNHADNQSAIPDAWLTRLVPATLPAPVASDLRTALEALALDLSDDPSAADLAAAARTVEPTLPRVSSLLATRHALRHAPPDPPAASAQPTP